MLCPTIVHVKLFFTTALTMVAINKNLFNAYLFIFIYLCVCVFRTFFAQNSFSSSVQARLRMDRRTSSIARKRRVNQLLRQLALYGARYTRIGGLDGRKTLSGGERKRLAFATEVRTLKFENFKINS